MRLIQADIEQQINNLLYKTNYHAKKAEYPVSMHYERKTTRKQTKINDERYLVSFYFCEF